MVNKLKSKENYWEKVYKENLFIMKLLTTHKEFLDDVKEIRSRLDIPIDGFRNRGDKTNWALKWDKKLPTGSEHLKDPRSLFFNAEYLIKKYKLRYNFRPYIELFILLGKTDAPKVNYDISSGPDPRATRSGKWISIKAYAPLTKEEIRVATKRLLEIQRINFSKNSVLDLRIKIDIDFALKVEAEMEKRKREIIEKPSDYLKAIRKSYGEEEFRRYAKIYPEKIETDIIKYTSKEVAQKIKELKGRDYLARQIYSRIKKKRKQLFG